MDDGQAGCPFSRRRIEQSLPISPAKKQSDWSQWLRGMLLTCTHCRLTCHSTLRLTVSHTIWNRSCSGITHGSAPSAHSPFTQRLPRLLRRLLQQASEPSWSMSPLIRSPRRYQVVSPKAIQSLLWPQLSTLRLTTQMPSGIFSVATTWRRVRASSILRMVLLVTAKWRMFGCRKSMLTVRCCTFLAESSISPSSCFSVWFRATILIVFTCCVFISYSRAKTSSMPMRSLGSACSIRDTSPCRSGCVMEATKLYEGYNSRDMLGVSSALMSSSVLMLLEKYISMKITPSAQTSEANVIDPEQNYRGQQWQVPAMLLRRRHLEKEGEMRSERQKLLSLMRMLLGLRFPCAMCFWCSERTAWASCFIQMRVWLKSLCCSRWALRLPQGQQSRTMPKQLPFKGITSLTLSMLGLLKLRKVCTLPMTLSLANSGSTSIILMASTKRSAVSQSLVLPKCPLPSLLCTAQLPRVSLPIVQQIISRKRSASVPWDAGQFEPYVPERVLELLALGEVAAGEDVDEVPGGLVLLLHAHDPGDEGHLLLVQDGLLLLRTARVLQLDAHVAHLEEVALLGLPPPEYHVPLDEVQLLVRSLQLLVSAVQLVLLSHVRSCVHFLLLENCTFVLGLLQSSLLLLYFYRPACPSLPPHSLLLILLVNGYLFGQKLRQGALISQEMTRVLLQGIDKGNAEIVPILDRNKRLIYESVRLLKGDCVDAAFVPEVYSGRVFLFPDLVEHAVAVAEGSEVSAQQFGDDPACISMALLLRYLSLPMASSSAQAKMLLLAECPWKSNRNYTLQMACSRLTRDLTASTSGKSYLWRLPVKRRLRSLPRRPVR